MADLVSGAVLGTAFGELYNQVKDMIIKFKNFKTNLENIKSRLDSLEPLINTIRDQGAKLNLPIGIIENLKEGKELVSKCSEVGEWSSHRKLDFANQLEELDRSLDRQIELLKLQGVSSAMEALVLLKNKDKDIAAALSLPVGFDVPLKELKTKILKDGVSKLVLTGPQGFGKTTLAKAFCQDEEVRDTFKGNVIFVLVSKNPDLEHIVQQMYRHKGSQLPNNIDLQGNAVHCLQTFLKDAGKDPLLLVLDDVWPGSESLLDNLKGPGIPDYKILVTSVFGFPSFGYQYYLKSLKHEDAMALFLHSASLKDKNLCACILEDLVEKIVQRCKGFPLAITFMGRALCGKPIEIWLNIVRVWEEDSFILGAGTDFLACVQRSLDALDVNNPYIKECFMDLSSFPENQRIPVPALIDMWEELYDRDEETILNLCEMITNHSLANHISTRKEKMEVDNYYSEHFLTQQYMLRQLAFYHVRQDPIKRSEKLIIEICGNNFPKRLVEQKYQPIKARLLSISTDQMFSQDLPPDMQAPEVKVLVLNFQTQNYSLPEFVQKMVTLKALIVRNHGFLCAELRRFQLLAFLPNLKRIRLEGIIIPSISNSYHEEKYRLQKISLFMCKKLGDAFIRCPNFPISKALPNLVELNIDCCNDLKILPDQLCGLILLEKLSITSCGKLSILPVGIGKLVNLQLLRLRSCTYLLKLPDSIENLTSLHSLDISYCFSIKKLPDSIKNLTSLHSLDISYCSSIKKLPEQFGEMRNLKKLNMRRCSGLEQLPESVSRLHQLRDVICDQEKENWLTDVFGGLNITN